MNIVNCVIDLPAGAAADSSKIRDNLNIRKQNKQTKTDAIQFFFIFTHFLLIFTSQYTFEKSTLEYSLFLYPFFFGSITICGRISSFSASIFCDSDSGEKSRHPFPLLHT